MSYVRATSLPDRDPCARRRLDGEGVDVGRAVGFGVGRTVGLGVVRGVA